MSGSRSFAPAPTIQTLTSHLWRARQLTVCFMKWFAITKSFIFKGYAAKLCPQVCLLQVSVYSACSPYTCHTALERPAAVRLQH